MSEKIALLWKSLSEPDTPSGERRRYPVLDGLRLCTAVAVVLIHTFEATTGKAPRWTPFDPVAVFIVISGFVIPASFGASRNWGHFAFKRFLRIAPALLCCLIGVWYVFGATAFISGVLIYLTGGLLIGAAQYTTTLWSLLTEEVLYAFHGLARTLKKLWSPRSSIALALISLCLCVATDHFPQHRPGGSPLPNIIVTFPHLSAAFFLGTLLYFYRDRVTRIPWTAALIVLIACFLLFHLPLTKGILYHFSHAAQAAAVVLVALKLPVRRWRLPDWSYGIYIFQIPVLGWLTSHKIDGINLWVAELVLTFLVATGSWYLIEQPALGLKNWTPQTEPTRKQVVFSRPADQGADSAGENNLLDRQDAAPEPVLNSPNDSKA